MKALLASLIVVAALAGCGKKMEREGLECVDWKVVDQTDIRTGVTIPTPVCKQYTMNGKPVEYERK